MPGKSGYDTQMITVFYGDKLVFRMCRSFLGSEEGTARLRGGKEETFRLYFSPTGRRLITVIK